MNKKINQPSLMIMGSNISTNSKPLLIKPKYVPPPKKVSKPIIVKKQQPKQQPQPIKEETKVVHLISDQDDNDNDNLEPEQQFILRSEPLNQKETVYIHRTILGEVVVRYSHYKEKFKIKDSLLLESDINQEYCLSFVFKGDYKLILKSADKQTILKNIGGGWEGCLDGEVYWLEIDEDPIQMEIDQKNSKPYQAPKDNSCPLRNKKVELISNELQRMSIQEIQEKGDKFKELVEARDLEDILYK